MKFVNALVLNGLLVVPGAAHAQAVTRAAFIGTWRGGGVRVDTVTHAVTADTTDVINVVTYKSDGTGHEVIIINGKAREAPCNTRRWELTGDTLVVGCPTTEDGSKYKITIEKNGQELLFLEPRKDGGWVPSSIYRRVNSDQP